MLQRPQPFRSWPLSGLATLRGSRISQLGLTQEVREGPIASSGSKHAKTVNQSTQWAYQIATPSSARAASTGLRRHQVPESSTKSGKSMLMRFGDPPIFNADIE
jgi:hypothetical protein